MARPQSWTNPKRKALCEAMQEFILDESIVHMTQVSTAQGLTHSALMELGKDYPEDVGLSLTLIKDVLESRIVSRAMDRTYDAGFAKFILGAKYGFQDKQVIDINKTETIPSFGDE